MKKIINNPTDVVSEALMGMQAAYPDKLVYKDGGHQQKREKDR